MKALCDFCFRHCLIEEEGYGWCRMRKNNEGEIESVDYASIPAIAIDPIEKKPLYHFLPGTKTLSFGASGCNLSCDFCQNWRLSQQHERGVHIDEDNAVGFALSNSIPSISFTYSEPLVWQDFMISVAREAKACGLRTIMVSNGSFSSEALNRILPEIDAFNIDLKGDNEFYRAICHGMIDPVLSAIEEIVKSGKHLEVTTMVIESMHSGEMIRNIGRMLAEREVSVWHLTRFFPQYKMNNLKPTSELYISKIIKIAQESGIPYIYPGNSILNADTCCPGCKKKLRHPGQTISEGICPYCGEKIYGVWN